jgi:hypothetical protein
VVSGRDPTDDERATHPRLIRFDSSVSYCAFRTEIDSEPGRWLSGALERATGEPSVIIRTMGGSVPISPFVEALGVPAVQVGAVNPDNNQHSPNENLRVFDFLRGIRTMAAILSEPLPYRTGPVAERLRQVGVGVRIGRAEFTQGGRGGGEIARCVQDLDLRGPVRGTRTCSGSQADGFGSPRGRCGRLPRRRVA